MVVYKEKPPKTSPYKFHDLSIKFINILTSMFFEVNNILVINLN